MSSDDHTGVNGSVYTLFSSAQFLSWGLVSFLSLGVVYAVACLFYYHPIAYSRLIVEDGLVENVTFSAYLVAAGCFAVVPLRHGLKSSLGPIVFSLGCFILGMEEISWGQRLFGFQPAEPFIAYNLQGETNLHNLFNHRSHLKSFVWAVLVWVVVWPILLRLKFKSIDQFQEIVALPLVSPHLWPCFVVVLVTMVHNIPPRGEEVYESLLGLLFVLVSLQYAKAAVNKAIVSGLVLVLAVVLTWHSFPMETYKRVLFSIADQDYRRMGLCHQELIVHAELERLAVTGFRAKKSRLGALHRSGNDTKALLKPLLLRHAGDSVNARLLRAQLLLAAGEKAQANQVLRLVESQMEESTISQPLRLSYVRTLLDAMDLEGASTALELIDHMSLNGPQKSRYHSFQLRLDNGGKAYAEMGRIQSFVYWDLFRFSNCQSSRDVPAT